MTFSTPEEMLGYLKEKGDLYNPDLETYVFVYNEVGSICEYSIDKEEAEELARKCKETGEEYWGAMLGPGGNIFDDESYDGYVDGQIPNLVALDDYCRKEGWVNINDYGKEIKA